MQTCYYVGVLDPVNKKKPIGMINALKHLGYEVDIFPNQENIATHKCYDLFFGEYLNLDSNLPWNQFKVVVFWTNVRLSDAVKCANVHPNTKFIVAPKSFLHDKNLIDWHLKIFGNVYSPSSVYENQNLIILQQLLNNGKQINPHCFHLLNNLFYCYLPCCLSEDTYEEVNKTIDIAYIGTTNNRPNVEKVISYLKSKYNIFSSFDSGFITPEHTVQIYKQSKIILTEQILPVVLEYPVRLGEASRQGCHVIAYTPVQIPQNFTLIPSHSQSTNFDEFINCIETKLNNFTPTIYAENTYISALNFLFNSIS